MEQDKNTDIVDIVSFIGSIIVTTAAFGATGTLFWALPVFCGHYVIAWVRRTEAVRKWRETMLLPPMLENIAPLLLPGPNEDTAIELKQNAPIDVRVVDVHEDAPFWKRVTQPIATESNQTVITGGTKRTQPLVNTQIAFLNRSLKRLRKYVHYTELPNPPSKLAVPIGVEAVDGAVLWGDFSSDGNLIHALVAGQTGSGKDALLRLWFTTLTASNTPQELQFVILDGKIDWLSPALAESAYMAIKPAGGVNIQRKGNKFVNITDEQMAENLVWVFEEIQRRTELMTACGAVDINSYYKRTGTRMPYLFVLASDIGDLFNDQLELLVRLLIARGRSYGVRLLLSMQNPVGENTKWRSQIGLVMSGYQQNPDHDRYIMGMNVDRLLIRPSQLPNPDENDISKGLFIVRHGGTQHLVRTAHMPEKDWFQYIETVLPKKRDVEDHNLLESLLSGNINRTNTLPGHYATQPILTQRQIEKITLLVQQGKNKTEIMYELGFTNGTIYSTKKDAVDIIINAVKRKIQQ